MLAKFKKIVSCGIALAFAPQPVLFAEVINDVSTDVMVLRVEVIGRVATDGRGDLKKERCLERQEINGGEWLDCTSAMVEQYGAPAIHGVILALHPGLICDIVRINTLSNSLAVASSEGIGFAHGRQDGAKSVTFIRHERLLKVGEMSLPNGSKGDVHQFLALAACSTSSTRVDYQFRPFLGFAVPRGGKYRNWDSFGFYEVPRGKGGFDQSSEIAKRLGDISALENAYVPGQSEFIGDRAGRLAKDTFLYGQ